MSDAPTAADAARDNAFWCDAVCRAHGAACETQPTHWLCRAPAPRFYPNLVTLAPDAAPALAAIRALDAAGLGGEWGVKDSFRSLDLAPLGFRALFDATWIARPAALGAPASAEAALAWRRVGTESELAAWEAAWGESANAPRVFAPALLANADVAILAGRRDGAIAAGAVASRSGAHVGLSNVFGDDAASAVRAAWDAFPGRTLLGYGSDAEVRALARLGFTPIGGLRVWVREAGLDAKIRGAAPVRRSLS